MFEPAFSVMAMERATDADRDAVGSALHRLVRAVDARIQIAEDDIAFHLAILHATKNPLVIRIGETIFQLFKTSISVSMQHIAERAVQDHRRIFEACCARDPARLRDAVLNCDEGWKRESLSAVESFRPRGVGTSVIVPTAGLAARRVMRCAASK